MAVKSEESRTLSPSFVDALLKGVLNPILERVKNDHTLMLAIRDGYINIYYRGGNLLAIKSATGGYKATFDTDYNKTGGLIPKLPETISTQEESRQWVEAFPKLKEVMDHYFSNHAKPEREFQQLIARENNFSTVSNQSEYFITDIEFADSTLGARFDMLAIQWLASDRKNAHNCKAALVEVKYGDDALGGNAGLKKHLKDIELFVSDPEKYGKLLGTMEGQLNQLHKLGLVNCKGSDQGAEVTLKIDTKPEVIFILANHNPRSKKLEDILASETVKKYAASDKFDLRFFVACSSGYAMHRGCMLSLADFEKYLKIFKVFD